MPNAKGVDVSHHQNAVDWQAVVNDGYSFAFIRASYVGQKSRVANPDRMFDVHWHGASATGLLLGIYHYFVPQPNCTDQIDFFWAQIQGRNHHFPLILDCEFSGGDNPAVLTPCIQACLDRLEQLAGRKPMIYTRGNWWNAHVLNQLPAANYNLWVANYQNPTGPIVPTAWQTWRFWQFAENATVPGVAGPADVNWFNGDVNALRAFAGV
ncbi:MAG TPA: glycoside hydrolase family 25 protein [Phototrophicaceae bacterium]|jgi:lysozyme|nr:glycoside hydrolase family 25 protein [Phototrophicaceae bacterium]